MCFRARSRIARAFVNETMIAVTSKLLPAGLSSSACLNSTFLFLDLAMRKSDHRSHCKASTIFRTGSLNNDISQAADQA